MCFKKLFHCNNSRVKERCKEEPNIFVEDTNMYKNGQDEDDIARDLMVLIGNAIEEWSLKYNFNNLPKYIVFEQALGIMNAWKDTFKK